MYVYFKLFISLISNCIPSCPSDAVWCLFPVSMYTIRVHMTLFTCSDSAFCASLIISHIFAHWMPRVENKGLWHCVHIEHR